MYAGLRRARSMRMPEATNACFTPGCCPAAFSSRISGPWSVFSNGQITGCRQLSRRHFSRTSGREQFIWYMLAVGPPRSLMVPEKSGCSAMRRISSRIDCWLRLWMMRPSWTVIEQNAQPPKQPRMIWTESFTTSKAGIRWRP